MNDSQCVAFLRWALPRLGMRWDGFRTVRRQVCNRVRKRVCELGLPDLAAYQIYLEAHPEEWALLDSLTCITISRFYRDRGVFDFLTQNVLPTLALEARARDADTLAVWSAGCASGEEPYTLAIIWELELARRFPALAIRILATDMHPVMLARARRGCYPSSSLRDVPEKWRSRPFVKRDALHCVRERYKRAVTIVHHDIRAGSPDGPFDLVMCRNLAFTYFDLHVQRAIAARIADSLRPGGALILGAHEQLGADLGRFEPWGAHHGVYRLIDNASDTLSAAP